MTRLVTLFCVLLCSLNASGEHFHENSESPQETSLHSHQDHEDEHNDHPQTPLKLPEFNLERVKQISREVTKKIFSLRPNNWAEVQEINGASVEHHPLEGELPKYRPRLVAKTSAQISRTIDQMNPQSWEELGEILKQFRHRVPVQVMKNIIAHKAFHKPTSVLEDDFDSSSSKKLGDIPELDELIGKDLENKKKSGENSPQSTADLGNSPDPFSAFKNPAEAAFAPAKTGTSTPSTNIANAAIPQGDDSSSISGLKVPSRPGDVRTNNRPNPGFASNLGAFNMGENLAKSGDLRSGNPEGSSLNDEPQNDETISTYNPPSSGASDPVLDQSPVTNPESPFPGLVQSPPRIQNSGDNFPITATQAIPQSARTQPFITAGNFTDQSFPDGQRKFLPTEPGKLRENVSFDSGNGGGYYNPLSIENDGAAIPSTLGQTLVLPQGKKDVKSSDIPPLFQRAGRNLFANMASRRNLKVATSSVVPSFELTKDIDKKRIVRAVAASTGLGEEQSTLIYHAVLGLAWLATVGFVSYVGRAVYEAAQQPQDSGLSDR